MTAAIRPEQMTPDQLVTPASDAIAVTPHDTNDLAVTARALWIGTGGALRIQTAKGVVVELLNVPSGTLLPVSAKRVYATGHSATAATGIVALY